MNLTNRREGFGEKILKFYVDKLLLHMGFSALWSSEDITRLWSLCRCITASHRVLITSRTRDGLLPPLRVSVHCYLPRPTLSFVLLT